MTGEALKRAIRGKGLTMQGAADKIGCTRQTLHTYTKLKKLPEDVIQIVKEKLGIEFSEEGKKLDVQVTDFGPAYTLELSRRYIERLEYQTDLQKQLIEKLQAEISRLKKEAKA